MMETEVSIPAAWTERLLGNRETTSWIAEGQRLLTGLGLAALFGAAIGLRAGPAASAMHALGVVLGVGAVCALAVPALGILLALADASIEAVELARATSRAAVTGGLVLAGLTPGAVLFAVTVEDALTVTLVTLGSLSLAGVLAMRGFTRELSPHLDSGAKTHVLARIALPSFLLFATVLAARVFWVSLPLLRGVS